MDILTSGCSFTNQIHPHELCTRGKLWQRPKFPDVNPTWSDFLYKRGHNTTNLGVPTNSNTNIVRSLIYHGQEKLKTNKEFSIIAQFSGLTRHQIFVSKKETTNWIEFLPEACGGNGKEFDWNLTNFTHLDFSEYFWILTGEHSAKDFANPFSSKLCQMWCKYFFNINEKQLNTLESMYDLQLFCKLNNIPYKIFFMSDNYLELKFFREDEKFKYMYNLIDWSSVWLYEGTGGMAEWMEGEVEDPGVRYMRNPYDKHPSNYSHEKFVDDVILKWEMFKNV
jgi:hypothetical protein